ncbi:MAG TPA: CHRD domain-containing protein, partial [Clostridia bacterium]|nr:CHRD domain-containing protein [Clostridia bacterium]
SGNYGWNVREGTFWFDAATGNEVNAPVRSPPTGMVDPIAQYDQDDGLAVIGGYLYRGSAIPPLTGRYVFGDWGSFSAPSGAFGVSGSLSGIALLTVPQLLNVIDNNTYVNVHTTANASGEIRGQLMK